MIDGSISSFAFPRAGLSLQCSALLQWSGLSFSGLCVNWYSVGLR